MTDIKKIALAYSGGLDTSVAIKWLADKYKAKIVTVTVDLGQEEDFKKRFGRTSLARPGMVKSNPSSQRTQDMCS
jgi:argininosuccinate synthase